MMERSSHQLTLRLFGYPEAEMDGLPIRLPRRKALALLAYLGICTTGAGREVLAALLWPEYDQGQAAAYLRQALWELNKALGKSALRIEGQVVCLAPDVGLWVDVLRFEEAMNRWKTQRAEPDSQAWRSLEDAVALCQGDFLAGFTLRDSPIFDDWQRLQAEALRRSLGEALAALAEGYAARGDLDMAIASVQRWLANDPLDEARQRELMRLYAWAGQRSAALRQYELCASQLRSDLGASPEAATVELFEQIRSGVIRPRGKPTVPASSSLSAAAISLGPEPRPAGPPTPFVGREAELEQLGRVLSDPECRLLTLIGPGGIGKTRLAQQYVRIQAGAYPHGVVWVPLATCSSGEQLLGAIAEALHLTFHPEADPRPILDQERSQLTDYLRSRTLLLVLDSMEHLADAAGLLNDILAEAPGVKVLVTSRGRLALPEEWVMEVRGLPYPARYEGEESAASGAVQLFVKCAQRTRADFHWQDAERPAMVRICQLVEGSPLGVELAAAWVGILSCQEIAAELERDLDLLVSRQRGAPERHASLRAVFEHSWKLLSEAERNAFSQLSVFQGGFTRSAAAQVARASLEMLSALADKSLLRRDASRYSIHQLLRQYAAEALERTPAARVGTLERHSSYYLDLLETAGERLMGPGQQEALEQLKAEAGNLRLALRTAIEGGKWERLQQVLAFWILFLEMCGSGGEAAETLQPVYAASRSAWAQQQGDVAIGTVLALALAAQRYFAPPPDARLAQELLHESLELARALPDSLEKAYILLLNSSGYGLPLVQSRAYGQQCLAIFQSHNHRWGQAMTHLILADTANYACKAYDEAEAAYQASRAIFEILGNRWGQAMCLTGLAHIAFQRQRYEQAIGLEQASLDIHRELGDPFRMGIGCTNLARYATAMGDYASAERYHQENLKAASEYGQRSAAALFLAHLGRIAHSQGNIPAARIYYQQSLDLYRQTKDTQGAAQVSRSLETLG